MNLAIKCMIVLACVCIIGACAKPLQPPPTAIESWVKPGVGREQLLKQLLECGFPNAGGFYGSWARDVTLIEQIRAERCMFDNGFRYRSGWKGICTLRGEDIRAACGDLVGEYFLHLPGQYALNRNEKYA